MYVQTNKQTNSKIAGLGVPWPRVISPVISSEANTRSSEITNSKMEKMTSTSAKISEFNTLDYFGPNFKNSEANSKIFSMTYSKIAAHGVPSSSKGKMIINNSAQ